MGRNSTFERVSNTETLTGQRTISAKLARHARQEPGRSNVGKKANPHLWHGKRKAIAGNAMRTMHRHADPAAHRNAVDQSNVGLSVVLDRRIERIFVAPELQCVVVLSGLPEIVKRANVAARGECALACGGHDNSCYRVLVSPSIELRAQAPAPWHGSPH